MRETIEYKAIGWRSYKRVTFHNEDGGVYLVRYFTDDRSQGEVLKSAVLAILSIILF